MIWALMLQVMFAMPKTHALAVQRETDVAVAVTYTDEKPVETCVATFALDDEAFLAPLESHCWTPTNAIGDINLFPGLRIFDVNFVVTVRYATHTDAEYLTGILDEDRRHETTPR